jgi:hypothetical protein
MEGDSKQITEAERSEPDPSDVLLTVGVRRFVVQAYADYQRLLVSDPGVLLYIRIFLAGLLLFE